MCGLIAYLKTSDRPLDPRLIEVMTHTMEQPGPGRLRNVLCRT